jgi:cytochrome P450
MPLPNLLKTPSFIQKFQWVTDPVKYMENAVQQHPDIFTAQVVGFGDTIVFVNDPKGVQEILSNGRKFVALGEMNKVLQPILGDMSILLTDGDRHKRKRQLLIPQFHGERMRAYGQLIGNITEKVLEKIPLNQPFLARDVTQEISLQVILEAVFGLYEGERCQKLKSLLPTFMSNVFGAPLTSTLLFFPSLRQDLGAWSPWGKFVRQRQQIDELIYAEIAERRQQPHSDRIDILSLLLSAQDQEGKPMTDIELRDELMTLMVAGYETTSNTITWAFYWIHYVPKVEEKLRTEIDSLSDDSDPMNIFRLPYLTAVCNETLRIVPVTIFTTPRVVQEPVELLGHQLEPGTILVAGTYLIHNREDIYPQPKQFQPERFLERQYSPYEFLPFGGGSRRCIGEALAQFEMKLVLAKILLNYQLKLTEHRPERPQRRGVTLAPEREVKMIITERRQSRERVTTGETVPAS